MHEKSILADSPIACMKEITTWVSTVLDLDHLLELIIETATTMMNARASSLLLVDRRRRKLYFKVATGEKKEEIRKFEVDIGQGIAGLVAEKGEPLLISDVTKDPRWFKKISESIGFETRSIACVPMKVEGETIGVVEIIDKEDGSPLRKEDLEILTAFAEMASTAIINARKIDRFRQENKDLKEALEDKYLIVGESERLKKVVYDAYKVANSKTSTVILGESGTGKELLARLIHRASPRKNKPMIVLNCAAFPETLLEAELFGHEKGAFTGAGRRKEGKLELADGGTLFLDEIGEMSPGMQAKLLRALQEEAFYRVGGTSPIPVDIRIISATNRPIERDVEEGRFREDLYYRLNVVQIHMPSLRDRKADIPLLAKHFLEAFKKERGLPGLELSAKALDRMVVHDWPGNVRELRNAIERAVVMGNHREILPEDLPIEHRKQRIVDLTAAGTPLKEAVDLFKKEFIRATLKKTGGNRSRAAGLMGIQRTYLSRLLSKYDLGK